MLTIVTPIFNGAQFIESNIKSIQNLRIPYEHIIIDGGSTDGTLNIIKKYSHIKLLHQKAKTGMYGAIDLGFQVSKGNYICWVNCDDTIVYDGFEKMLKFGSDNNLDFVASKGYYNFIKENRKQLIPSTRFLKYFLQKGIFPFCQPSTIYKKSLYLKVNGLDFNNYKICGDMDLFYRMSCVKNAKFGYLPVLSTVFLKYGESLGDKNTNLAIKEKKIKGTIPKVLIFDRILYKLVRLLGV